MHSLLLVMEEGDISLVQNLKEATIVCGNRKGRLYQLRCVHGFNYNKALIKPTEPPDYSDTPSEPAEKLEKPKGRPKKNK